MPSPACRRSARSRTRENSSLRRGTGRSQGTPAMLRKFVPGAEARLPDRHTDHARASGPSPERAAADRIRLWAWPVAAERPRTARRVTRPLVRPPVAPVTAPRAASPQMAHPKTALRTALPQTTRLETAPQTAWAQRTHQVTAPRAQPRQTAHPMTAPQAQPRQTAHPMTAPRAALPGVRAKSGAAEPTAGRLASPRRPAHALARCPRLVPRPPQCLPGSTRRQRARRLRLAWPADAACGGPSAAPPRAP